HRGPDSQFNRGKPKPPTKRVSLEEEDHSVDRESGDQTGLRRDSAVSVIQKQQEEQPEQPNHHLFIDPKVLNSDADRDAQQPLTSDIPGESAPSSGRTSTRVSQTAAASSGFGARAAALTGPTSTAIVPYDQSRLAIHISTAEAEQFAEYWDHSVFAAARVTAVGLATVATVCLICSAGASTWVYHGTGLYGISSE
ncbi:unnamed protein product, partial [Echinostoma caproni]|uniref:Transmembrane protein n=1 Tax=Echinostoma caproni TaxID=27848 RepID=A0A183B8C7_9TREM